MKHWMSDEERIDFLEQILAYQCAVTGLVGYATPDDMRAGGWQMDYHRDEKGRLL